MRLAPLLTTLIALSILCTGCATSGGGNSDDLVMASLTTFKEGIESGDLDKAMSAYADDFSTSDGADKAGARAFFQNAKDNGLLDNIEVGIEEAELMYEEGEAIVEPVSLLSDAGVLELTLFFKQVDDLWLIVGAEEF